ncbi:hypothetical protein [Streptomyces niveus]|uniref:hypothetical protein n=1 Tax=Streptomyces niveus TaxID=193462 RepID=UPI0033DE0D8A
MLAICLTAVEALTHPNTAWWPYLWPTAWALTAAALAAWLALRAAEKRQARRQVEATGSDPNAEATEPPSVCDPAA